MYQPRTSGYTKSDQAKRWALPDRVFFACGACHILAHAFLERYGEHDIAWIKPAAGHTGNHIFVGGANWVFDYHGYSDRETFLHHTWKRARQRWPGWDATLVQLPPDALISEARSRMFDGLWLREPRQFLHDALPRAREYLKRFSLTSSSRRYGAYQAAREVALRVATAGQGAGMAETRPTSLPLPLQLRWHQPVVRGPIGPVTTRAAPAAKILYPGNCPWPR